MNEELKTYTITHYVSGSRSYEVQAVSGQDALDLFKASKDQEAYLVCEDLEVDDTFMDEG